MLCLPPAVQMEAEARTVWNEQKSHRLGGWESFEAKVAAIDRETRELKRTCDGHVAQPLYRGHRDANWHLETTLDRRRPRVTLDEYLTIMERVQPQIERIYRRKWPNLGQEIAELRRTGLDSIWLFPVEGANTESILSFMVHLRQHGFPSPLLDWTSDPYRAAFFAFSGIERETQEVAIYTFRERTGSTADAKTVEEPCAMALGPHIRNTSPRHAKQRSQYTWCVERLESRTSLDCYMFSDHERAVNLPGFRIEAGTCIDVDRAENIVDKYTIPASEQSKALASLAQRKITACRLFGPTVDNLLVDLWHELVVDSAA